jgi:hypothetical protein
MMMFLAIVALAATSMLVDGGRWLAAHRRAVDVAASAARAAVGAQRVGPDTVAGDDALVVRSALDHARASGIADGDVSVAVVRRDGGAVDVVVRVTVRTRTVLAGAAGVSELAASAAVSARLVYSP